MVDFKRSLSSDLEKPPTQQTYTLGPLGVHDVPLWLEDNTSIDWKDEAPAPDADARLVSVSHASGMPHAYLAMHLRDLADFLQFGPVDGWDDDIDADDDEPKE